MRLLDIIADSQNLKVLTGDIDNALIQDHTAQKIYTRCGPELSDREHSIAVIVRVYMVLLRLLNDSEQSWKIS